MSVCEICGKSLNEDEINNYEGLILCKKHYNQINQYGRVFDNSPTNIQHMNEYVIDYDNEIAYIKLTNRQNQFMGNAIIDLEDLNKVIVHKWRYWEGRVYTGNFDPIPLQYFVLDANKYLGKNIVIDHINSNPLDNRKCNLRITTQLINCCNKSLQSNNKSNFAGINFDKSRNKYATEIHLYGKKCYLGRYDLLEDAVYARFVAEVLTFGNARSTQNDHNIKQMARKCTRQKEIYDYVCTRLDKTIGNYLNI